MVYIEEIQHLAVPSTIETDFIGKQACLLIDFNWHEIQQDDRRTVRQEECVHVGNVNLATKLS